MFTSAARTPSRLRETVSAFEDIGTVKASGGHHRQFQLTGRQRPADVHEVIVNILFAKPQHLRKITSGVFSASQYIDHILPDSSHLPSVHECSCPRDTHSGIVSHPMPRAPNRTFFVGYCIRFVKARCIRKHCTAHSDSQSQRGWYGRVARAVALRRRGAYVNLRAEWILSWCSACLVGQITMQCTQFFIEKRKRTCST